jgi:hypothetical protein
MPEQHEIPPSTFSPERLKAFIEMLDKLAYEKPAGFAAYMAACMAHNSNICFTDGTAKPPKK